MNDHAKPRVRARNTYQLYLRPRRLIQDAIATRSGVLPLDVRRKKARVASATIIKLYSVKPDIVDVEIENYILAENQKLHKHESLNHNRHRRSLFRKTVSAPYQGKTTEVPYQKKSEKHVHRTKKVKKKAPYHHRNNHSVIKLVAAVFLLVAVGGLGLLFNHDKQNNTLTNVALYDEDMTVSGAPLDISEQPQVLGKQIEAKKPEKVPSRLSIPALGVAGDITPVGLHPNGTLAQPENKRSIGWYRASAPPGVDSAVLLSAYHDDDSPLSRAAAVKNDDFIEIVDKSGESFWYKVSTIDFYEAGKLPMNDLVTINKGERLVIVLSNGSWNDLAKQFSERIVVVAQPVK